MALLSVDNLSVSFVTRNGTNKAVDNVSFSVEERQITAIIGESGSGKSVSCYAMLGLVPTRQRPIAREPKWFRSSCRRSRGRQTQGCGGRRRQRACAEDPRCGFCRAFD